MTSVGIALLLASLGSMQTLIAGEPTPLAVIALAKEGQPFFATSSFLPTMFQVLMQRTDTRAQPIDAGLVMSCGGRLACIIAAVHDAAPQAKRLVLLTHLGTETRSEVINVLFVDVGAGWQEISGRTSDSVLEARLSERAILGRWVGERIDVHAVETGATQWVERIASAPGAELGRPRGRLVVESDREHVQVILDERVLGVSTSTRFAIVGVETGVRELELVHANDRRLERTRVEQEGFLKLQFAPQTEPSTHQLRYAATGGGAAAVTTGVALVIFAALRGSSDDAVLCLERAMSDRCSGRPFAPITTDFEPGNPFVAPSRSSMALAPLGMSLITLGASWLVGSEFLGAEDEAPWITIAGGVGLGLATYLVAVVADGRSVFDQSATR